MKTKSILLVEDDQEITELITEALKDEGYRIICANDGNLALKKYKNENFDLIITDIFMPKLNGMELIAALKSTDEKGQLPIPIIVVSGQLEDFKPQIIVLDNVSFLEKPFKAPELISMVNQLINPRATALVESKKTLEAGDILLKEGETGGALYYILAGKFKVSTLKNNEEIQLNTIGHGELVGEMSLIDDRPRSATVTALQKSEVIEIPHKKFASILSNQPQWMKILIKNLSLRLRNTNQKIHLDE